MEDGISPDCSLFQSTLPQGEWQISVWFHRPDHDFNPHSHKGSDPVWFWFWWIIRYFNPHSHKGSDKCEIEMPKYKGISIHTPTRGVTILCVFYSQIFWFQSTLPQGEWHFPKYHIISCCLFQSTLPQGEWRITREACTARECISIHTPTRGVTVIPGAPGTFDDISIHTPTRGVTARPAPLAPVCPISIHTPTRGVTTLILWCRSSTEDFNPHSHKGSDSNFC